MEECLPSPSSPAWRTPLMPSPWRGKPAVQGPEARSRQALQSRPVSRLAVKGFRPPARACCPVSAWHAACRQFVVEYHREHGIVPHPSTLVQMFKPPCSP